MQNLSIDIWFTVNFMLFQEMKFWEIPESFSISKFCIFLKFELVVIFDFHTEVYENKYLLTKYIYIISCSIVTKWLNLMVKTAISRFPFSLFFFRVIVFNIFGLNYKEKRKKKTFSFTTTKMSLKNKFFFFFFR